MDEQQKSWFSNQIRENQASLYRLGFSILKNDEDVADAIQSATLSAFENIESLKEKEKFKPWILKILANKCYEMRRQNPQNISFDESLETEIEAPDNSNNLDNSITIKEYIERLNEPYRTVVILFYFEDMPIREISKVLNRNESTIKKQLQRGRIFLREMLNKEGEQYEC